MKPYIYVYIFDLVFPPQYMLSDIDKIGTAHFRENMWRYEPSGLNYRFEHFFFQNDGDFLTVRNVEKQ